MELILCEYNMDYNTVDLLFTGGVEVSISCEAVENLYDVSVPQQAELDFLIYNKPLEYAELVFARRIGQYLQL